MKTTKRNISKVLEENGFSISKDYSNGRIRWLTCSTWWVEILWDLIMKTEYKYFNNYKNRIVKTTQKQTWVFGIDLIARTMWNNGIKDYDSEMKKILNILKENFDDVILDKEWQHYIMWKDDSMNWFKIVIWDVEKLKEDHNQIITKTY